jgi:hypothetical protein
MLWEHQLLERCPDIQNRAQVTTQQIAISELQNNE